MAPFDLNLEQTRALWSRIDAPLLLVSGSESEFAKLSAKTCSVFSERRVARVRKRWALGSS